MTIGLTVIAGMCKGFRQTRKTRGVDLKWRLKIKIFLKLDFGKEKMRRSAAISFPNPEG
jgi:hypothetical protein